MNRLATTLMNAAWKLAMLGLLAVGVQAVGNSQPPVRPVTQADLSPVAEIAVPAKENRQRIDAAAQAREVQAQEAKATAHEPEPQVADTWGKDGPTAMTYGPNGTFITLEDYYKLHPEARYHAKKPRPRWRYREPTCTPSPAQIAWAKMLPNHDGLASRGLSDEQIVAYFAPSEVKALEGNEVPEHLRPDTRPAVVYVNGRCLNGTCTTGYCEASRRNLGCKDGRCPVPER